MLLANLFIQFFFYNQVYKEWTALQALAINKRLCKIQKIRQAIFWAYWVIHPRKTSFSSGKT